MSEGKVPSQPASGSSSDSEDEIDIREVFAALWRGKWLIICVTLVFAIAGAAYALLQPNEYTASSLLVPTEGESGGRLSGQLAGLASLAGVNFGGGDANKAVIAKEVIESRAFLADFIRRHNLAVPLMAAKGWSTEKQKWVIDQDIYVPDAEVWGKDDDGNSLKPTDWDLVKQFRELLALSESKENGMITINLTTLSPVASKNWLERLVRDLNDHMRAQDVAEAEASIEYLEGKLEDTNIAGMQQVFYQLIESETRTIMLASAQPEYVFKTIDPPVVPQEPSGPKRVLILVVATMLGGILGIFMVFLWSVSRPRLDDKPV